MNYKQKIEDIKKDSTNALEIAVCESIIGGNDEPEQYIKDVLQSGCQSGTVGELIYYHDTKAFYIKYLEEIEEIKNEIEDAQGEPLEIGTPMYNWLAWLGYEETTRKIAEQIGLEL